MHAWWKIDSPWKDWLTCNSLSGEDRLQHVSLRVLYRTTCQILKSGPSTSWFEIMLKNLIWYSKVILFALSHSCNSSWHFRACFLTVQFCEFPGYTRIELRSLAKMISVNLEFWIGVFTSSKKDVPKYGTENGPLEYLIQYLTFATFIAIYFSKSLSSPQPWHS